MDPLTVVTVSSLLLLTTRGVLYRFQYSLETGLLNRYIMANGNLKSVGGVWFGLIGAPLAAWFIVTFYIAPLLGLGNYPLNINTIIAFGQPIAILLFFGIWGGIAFGFFGGSMIFTRRGKKR